MEYRYHIALAGNPNVGKSTVFNNLTGLHQHTGNWPGKTVENKTGFFRRAERDYAVTDLPGTYSLDARSPEEAIAGAFLCSGQADCVVVVCDGSCLERNLFFALQVLARTGNCVLCVNLMDEAAKRGVQVDDGILSEMLSCPVVLCAAGVGMGMDALTDAIAKTAAAPRLPPKTYEDYGATLLEQAHTLANACVHTTGQPDARDRRIDRLLTGRITAYPCMAALVLLVFWLTIRGAGYLSAGLEGGLGFLVRSTRSAAVSFWGEVWFVSLLWDGILTTLCQVIAVMLPPMAVFFPLFTLLEDSGYLPRVAFNLDRLFQRCGSCGKQALTMLMGFGCNAAGVTGCRIIDSHRERMIAILTNAFVPCNGRFPLVIFLSGALCTMGLGLPHASDSIKAVLLTLCIFLCTLMTLAVSAFLNATFLRGQTSSFTLELPPYRLPRLRQVLLRSVLDRTVFVLARAVSVAAPAGGIIWLAGNLSVGDGTLLQYITEILDPIGHLAGMDGVILTAFLLSLPAAEIFLPLAYMGYCGTGVLQMESVRGIGEVFAARGWNGTTVVCVLLFTLFHFPCSTTLLTVRKETGQWRWVILAFLLPTLIGYGICCIVRLIVFLL